MFEYWFLKGTETHHGTTHDFLEVLSQIAIHFDTQTAGRFTEALLGSKRKELSFLRVTDWNFEFSVNMISRPDEPEQTIKLHKLK